MFCYGDVWLKVSNITSFFIILSASSTTRAQTIAETPLPALLLGESGTGKELLARAIHDASAAADGPFIAVNCGAIPRSLLESELFGYAPGAHTGALREGRAGYLEQADGGTLFLDEIGDLPLTSQVAFLRVLQDGSFQKVGASEATQVSFRLVCATNQKLPELVRAGSFREDLFYRIAVGIIPVPALRDRPADIALLVDHFLGELNGELVAEAGRQPKRLTAGARRILLRHPWPGNVRELQNTLARALLWTERTEIEAADIESAFLQRSGADTDLLSRSFDEDFSIKEIVKEVQLHYLDRALRQTGGNQAAAARLLGIGDSAVGRWLQDRGQG